MDRKNGVNILITGTPGVGKSTLCRRVADSVGVRYLNIAELIKERDLHSGWDDELGASIFDEDKLFDALSSIGLPEGGFLLDFHSCDGIDDFDVDHVVVLHAEIEELTRRLNARGYSDRKIDVNLESEIFKVCLNDALEVFGAEKVVEFPHNNEAEGQRAFEHVLSLLTHSGS